ncbi:hypothetical protein DINM_006825 [Dirofilaria immitis]|nr:hypothetical protein [Dirofilaria immitis]
MTIENDVNGLLANSRTGRTRLPKTPKRGYCFSQEAETFQKCRKKLLDSVTLKTTCVFANDENTATHIAQTPKSSKNAIAMNKYPPAFGNNTPKRTPFRNMMTSKATAQKIVGDSEVIRKATVTPKTAIEKSVTTPKITDKKVALTPKAVVQQPTFKRSEVIRKMEKRTNTVIKNKEEFMKEKAERARRDREERALRVKMNNKKKEEEALEKLRIIKMREQQIAELRQKQCMPQRAISKSPCRTRVIITVYRNHLFVRNLHTTSLYQGTHYKGNNKR